MNLLKIEAVIRPLVEASGFELYDIEFVGRTLRVSINKQGGPKQAGVTLEDCVSTSRLINPVLDVEELVPGGHYELEVSSPGLDRSLRKPEHFASAVGEVIHVTTHQPLSSSDEFLVNRRNFTGKLEALDNSKLTLTVDNRQIEVPFSAIAKAYVEFKIPITPKKGKKV